MKQEKAAIYLRISKDSERTGDAIARQREDCQWMCDHYHYTVYREYVDDSISAYSGRQRPAFQRMLRDYKSGKFDVIVAWKVDRLTRSTSTFGKMLEELEGQKLHICTTDTGNFDLSRADSKFMIELMVIFAEFESARKSERQVRANQQRAARGTRKKGYHTFGYDLSYNVIEENAATVRAIYQAVVDGHALNAIARSLSGTGDQIKNLPPTPVPNITKYRLINKQRAARGLALKPMPENHAWARTTLIQILRNPFYAGYTARMPWSEWQKGTTRRRMKDFIVCDDDGNPIKSLDHEAIVDESLWWAVQNILDDPVRYRNRGGNNRKYLGTNLYRCNICGKPLFCSRGAYQCYEKGHVSRKGDKIDAYVRALVAERLHDKRLIKAFKQAAAPDVKNITNQIEDLRSKIARATTLLIELDQSKTARAQVLQQIDRFEQQISQLEDQRRELTQESTIDTLAAADDPAVAFEKLPVKEQARIVDMLMTVTLDKRPRGQHMLKVPQGVHVEWKA